MKIILIERDQLDQELKESKGKKRKLESTIKVLEKQNEELRRMKNCEVRIEKLKLKKPMDMEDFEIQNDILDEDFEEEQQEEEEKEEGEESDEDEDEEGQFPPTPGQL